MAGLLLMPIVVALVTQMYLEFIFVYHESSFLGESEGHGRLFLFLCFFSVYATVGITLGIYL